MGRVARKYPTGRFILRTPAKVDEDTLYPVYLYYSYNRIQLRQSTSIMTKVKDWNKDANHGIGELRASYGSDFRKKNQNLQKMLRKIDGSIFDYVEQNGSINADVIKGFMYGDDKLLRVDKGQTFEGYALNLLGKHYKHRKIRVSTYKNSVCIIKKFSTFLNESSQGKTKHIFVGDITEELVRDFLVWGLERGRKTDTIEKYLEIIAKVSRQASDDGLLPKKSALAIADITLEKSIDDDTRRSIKYLASGDMSRFIHINRNQLKDKQVDVLDMFLFAFYACGLRISDVITLRWCDVDFDRKELNKIQVKTRGRNIIPLSDEAMVILEKWKGRHNVFVFGLLSDNFDLRDEDRLRTRRNSITSTINKQLDTISKEAQLDKKVTFHMARHTWAVNALEHSTPISMISSLLGHSGTAITEKVYAEFRQEAKAEAVRNLKFNLF